MDSKIKNIDDLFRQSLGGYTEAPPPNIWESLEERLDNNKKKKPAFMYRWYWFAALIFCISISSALYYTHLDNSAITSTVSNSPIAVSAHTAKKTTQPVVINGNINANATATETNIAATTTTKNNKKRLFRRRSPKNDPSYKISALPATNNSTNSLADNSIANKNIPSAPANIGNSVAPSGNEAATATTQDKEKYNIENTVSYVVKRTRVHNIKVIESEPMSYEVANNTEMSDEDEEEHTTFSSSDAIASTDRRAIYTRNRRSIITTAVAKDPLNASTTQSASIPATASKSNSSASEKVVYNTPIPTTKTVIPKEKTQVSRPVLPQQSNPIASAPVNTTNATNAQPVASQHTEKALVQVASGTSKLKGTQAVSQKRKVLTKNELVTAVTRATVAQKITATPVLNANKKPQPTTKNQEVTSQTTLASINTPKRTKLRSHVVKRNTAKQAVTLTTHTPKINTPVKSNIKHATKRENTAVTIDTKTKPTIGIGNKRIQETSLASTKTNVTKSPTRKMIAANVKTTTAATPKNSHTARTRINHLSVNTKNNSKQPKLIASNSKLVKAQPVNTDSKFEGTKETKNSTAKTISTSKPVTKVAVKSPTNKSLQQDVAGKKKQARSTKVAIAARVTPSKTLASAKVKNTPKPTAKSIIKLPTHSVEEAFDENVFAATNKAASNVKANEKATATQKQDSALAKADSNASGKNQPEPTAEKSGFKFLKGFDIGIKVGYEGGFGKDGANKMVISPYLERKLNSRMSILFQPSIKFSNAKGRDLSSGASYYEVVDSSCDVIKRMVLVQPNGDTMWRYDYWLAETYRVVGKQYKSGGRYLEMEMPILFKYMITDKLSVYGGGNITYSKYIPIKENNTYGALITLVDSTRFSLNQPTTFNIAATLQPPGTPLSSYNGPLYPSQPGGTFRLGYMLGFSYEFQKRWMADVLIQHAKVRSNVQGGVNVNSVLSAPYFRFTIGYRLN